MAYGKEIIIDLYNCNSDTFSRESISEFFEELCVLVNMEREDLHFWDYEGVSEDEIPYDQPHLIGISAIQFIKTSNITIHALSILKECYINLFSCKPFNSNVVTGFVIGWFEAHNWKITDIERGKDSKYDCSNDNTDRDRM